MKKRVLIILILAVFFGVGNCFGNDFPDKIIVSGMETNTELKSVPVYVFTKGTIGPPLGGSKIVLPFGQYIAGKDGKLINVSGFSIKEIFEVGLASYGLKKEGIIVRAVRYASVDSQTTLYIFDYR